jgi:hypothetical protein
MLVVLHARRRSWWLGIGGAVPPPPSFAYWTSRVLPLGVSR